VFARATAYPLRVHVRTRIDRVQRRVRDLTYGSPDSVTQRDDLARRCLRGSGLEIGALNRPLRVPRGVGVRYVDRLAVDGLRAVYPSFADRLIVAPDIIDDCAELLTVADASVDFVIANHVFEHMENPIRALRTWLRVVRAGGVIYLAVPDKRRTFDSERPSTSTEHLERDFADGPSWSRSGHYTEYALLAEKQPPDQVADRAAELEAGHADIHFHVWDRAELVAFLVHLAGAHAPFELEVVQANDLETLVILRKC